MTTQEQIKDAEAKLKQLKEQRASEIEISYPVFSQDGIVFRKVFSRTKGLNVIPSSSFPSIGLDCYSEHGSTTYTGYDRIISGNCEIITEAEFEAARTETLKKLSEL